MIASSSAWKGRGRRRWRRRARPRPGGCAGCRSGSPVHRVGRRPGVVVGRRQQRAPRRAPTRRRRPDPRTAIAPGASSPRAAADRRRKNRVWSTRCASSRPGTPSGATIASASARSGLRRRRGSELGAHAPPPRRRDSAAPKPWSTAVAGATARSPSSSIRGSSASARRARFHCEDARLVAVGVAPAVVDGAEHRRRIVAIHERARAVVDRLARDRRVVGVHHAVDEADVHPAAATSAACAATTRSKNAR